MSGLTADSSNLKLKSGVICKYMRNECLNYKYVFESNHPLNRLIQKVAESKCFFIKESQHKTH